MLTQLGGLVSLEAEAAQQGDTKVNESPPRGAHLFKFTNEQKQLFTELPGILRHLQKEMKLLTCNKIDTLKSQK